jgi:hypothetical protein
MAKISSKAKPSVGRAKRRGEPRVLGVTKDGVKILASKVKPTHFTTKEIRDAIAALRASKDV